MSTPALAGVYQPLSVQESRQHAAHEHAAHVKPSSTVHHAVNPSRNVEAIIALHWNCTGSVCPQAAAQAFSGTLGSATSHTYAGRLHAGIWCR
jgi:hypothetical protein